MVWMERKCLIVSVLNFEFHVFELLISSVSSFVRKTTEKIGTLHVSPDIRGRQEAKDDEHQQEVAVSLVASPQEERVWVQNHVVLAIVLAGCSEASNLKKMYCFKENGELSLVGWLVFHSWCLLLWV